jgi:NAD(P)-dependent dehydrogenase (short-subunit alcohol dehydrogenase family)
MHASALLQPGLLEGVQVALVAPSQTRPSGDGEAAREACESLGAAIGAIGVEVGGEPADEALDGKAAELLGGEGPVVVVVDGEALFAAGGLRACLDAAWDGVRAVIAGVVIPAKGDGRVVLLGPRPGAGPGARSTRDALENMARTLSIEWSPYGIRSTAALPGAATPAEDLGALVAYLASPAGDYFSGCRLELGRLG